MRIFYYDCYNKLVDEHVVLNQDVKSGILVYIVKNVLNYPDAKLVLFFTQEYVEVLMYKIIWTERDFSVSRLPNLLLI